MQGHLCVVRAKEKICKHMQAQNDGFHNSCFICLWAGDCFVSIVRVFGNKVFHLLINNKLQVTSLLFVRCTK